MSNAFSKKYKIKDALYDRLLSINTSNSPSGSSRKYAISIKKVVWAEAHTFKELDYSYLPAIFFTFTESLEIGTNQEYDATLAVNLYIWWMPQNDDEGLTQDISLIDREIKRAIMSDWRLGLGYIDSNRFINTEDPVYLSNKYYQLTMDLEIKYHFNRDEP